MHNRIYYRYIFASGLFLILFSSFIACGSQLYKMSLHNDYESKSSSNSASKNTSLNGIHATNGWTSLPISFTFDPNMTPEQRAYLYSAMKTWEKSVGKVLFRPIGIDTKTGDSFPDLYSSLDDQINGQYFDRDWQKTKKPDYVLATTIWTNGESEQNIITSDIRFNCKNYLFGDSLVLKSEFNREVVDIQSLALHELGHFLGLGHMNESEDRSSIMNPALYIGEGLTSRFLSKGDIERIQSIYGCGGENCDADKLFEILNNELNNDVIDPLSGEKFSL